MAKKKVVKRTIATKKQTLEEASKEGKTNLYHVYIGATFETTLDEEEFRESLVFGLGKLTNGIDCYVDIDSHCITQLDVPKVTNNKEPNNG